MRKRQQREDVVKLTAAILQELKNMELTIPEIKEKYSLTDARIKRIFSELNLNLPDYSILVLKRRASKVSKFIQSQLEKEEL